MLYWILAKQNIVLDVSSSLFVWNNIFAQLTRQIKWKKAIKLWSYAQGRNTNGNISDKYLCGLCLRACNVWIFFMLMWDYSYHNSSSQFWLLVRTWTGSCSFIGNIFQKWFINIIFGMFFNFLACDWEKVTQKVIVT